MILAGGQAKRASGAIAATAESIHRCETPTDMSPCCQKHVESVTVHVLCEPSDADDAVGWR